jgi:hypothetical protein
MAKTLRPSQKRPMKYWNEPSRKKFMGKIFDGMEMAKP